ncbi:MAG: 16S rRNA (cytidine(1402)-2'-O)-methyltransferase [Candidatus Methylumidiphilus sp.]
MADDPKGILYLVATPIGNLADFTFRAVDVLNEVSFIACEDTRHSRPLLDRYAIDKPLTALHEHNEASASAKLLDRMLQGESMALISDAGTPLINDPGFRLVRMAVEHGVRVVPVPGACALVAALSASGLSANRFSFEGFPPRTSSARRTLLEGLSDDARTLIFYESSHRVLDFVKDIACVLPSHRSIVIARELTKLHETILRCAVSEAVGLIESDPFMEKGEFALLIEGATQSPKEELTAEQLRVLQLLLQECSVKTAASLAAKITGARKELLYQAALRSASKLE